MATRMDGIVAGGNRLRWFVWGGAAALLLVPWVAMRFTREVQWTGLDFAVMAGMLAIACGLYELATRVSPSTRYRAAAGAAVLTGFLLLWVNLAVGVIGSEHNPVNRAYLVLLAGLVLAALVVRARARAMAGVMVGAATLQAAIAGVAWFAGWGNGLGPTVLFAALWLVCAALFLRAGTESA